MTANLKLDNFHIHIGLYDPYNFLAFPTIRNNHLELRCFFCQLHLRLIIKILVIAHYLLTENLCTYSILHPEDSYLFYTANGFDVHRNFRIYSFISSNKLFTQSQYRNRNSLI